MSVYSWYAISSIEIYNAEKIKKEKQKKKVQKGKKRIQNEKIIDRQLMNINLCVTKKNLVVKKSLLALCTCIKKINHSHHFGKATK